MRKESYKTVNSYFMPWMCCRHLRWISTCNLETPIATTICLNAMNNFRTQSVTFSTTKGWSCRHWLTRHSDLLWRLFWTIGIWQDSYRPLRTKMTSWASYRNRSRTTEHESNSTKLSMNDSSSLVMLFSTLSLSNISMTSTIEDWIKALWPCSNKPVSVTSH